MRNSAAAAAAAVILILRLRLPVAAASRSRARGSRARGDLLNRNSESPRRGRKAVKIPIWPAVKQNGMGWNRVGLLM